jgi:hypothetical protein
MLLSASRDPLRFIALMPVSPQFPESQTAPVQCGHAIRTHSRFRWSHRHSKHPRLLPESAQLRMRTQRQDAVPQKPAVKGRRLYGFGAAGCARFIASGFDSPYKRRFSSGTSATLRASIFLTSSVVTSNSHLTSM